MTDSKKDNDKTGKLKQGIEGTMGIKSEKETAAKCIHCGSTFNPLFSSGGEYGICQNCIDD